MHKLLKTVAAASLVLAAAFFFLGKRAGDEAPLSHIAEAEISSDTTAKRPAENRPEKSPSGFIHNKQTTTSTPPPGMELNQEEQAAQAECWALCGAPCAGEEGSCPPECETDDECKADELCLPTRMTSEGIRRMRCLSDQCSGIGADSDCGPGATCRSVSRLEGNIYLCAQAGRRVTGEPCGDSEFDDIGLCAVGLHCLNGECSPLSCEADEDCGATARCFGFANGERQCVPFCKTDDDCPDTKVCNKEREIGHCVEPSTMGCLRSGCDEGSECVVHTSAAYLSVTSCMSSCSESSDCEEGWACGNTRADLSPYCYQHCDEDIPCKDGWTCGDPGIVSLADESAPPMCTRDTDEAVTSFFEEHDTRPSP